MKHPISLSLLFAFALFEAGNMTGFSWSRMQYVSETEIIDAAVRYRYSGIYSNLRAMQADYSNFKPEVRYWGSWTWQTDNGAFDKFFGMTRYQVRIQGEVVMVSTDGEALFSRQDSSCGDEGCPPIAPDNPETGIVGTVQLDRPNYEPAQKFSVQWKDGAKGDVLISGHCFSAYRNTASHPAPRLIIHPEGAEANTIHLDYGFHLVAIAGNSYSSLRISKAEFLKSKSCSQEARANWPNVGGYSWKR